jgi:glutaredoxin 3
MRKNKSGRTVSFGNPCSSVSIRVHPWLTFLVKTRLFIKSYCPWCHKAMHWLDEYGIKYETLDVIANEKAFDEMVRLSGQELAPVIEADGKVLADFGPEELARFWEMNFRHK